MNNLQVFGQNKQFEDIIPIIYHLFFFFFFGKLFQAHLIPCSHDDNLSVCHSVFLCNNIPKIILILPPLLHHNKDYRNSIPHQSNCIKVNLEASFER